MTKTKMEDWTLKNYPNLLTTFQNNSTLQNNLLLKKCICLKKSKNQIILILLVMKNFMNGTRKFQNQSKRTKRNLFLELIFPISKNYLKNMTPTKMV
jgi:hypothetical protein